LTYIEKSLLSQHLIPYYHRFNPEEISGAGLDQFLALGWFRMHQYIFTTSHIEQDELYRVHWLRYALHEIRNHASHTRILNRNQAFRFIIEDFTAIRTDHADLHRRYRASINFDGAISIQECLFGDANTASNIFNTRCLSVFDEDTLIAGGYFDVGENSATSILHFFDPLYRSNSLGKYLILLTVDYLKSHGYTFYYPGYVVEGLSKMNYKLFLGKEEARYFDPEMVMWRSFQDSILIRHESDRNQLPI
jgi:leucyl-tRNA---protein transferase